MTKSLDPGGKPERTPMVRKSSRTALAAEVSLRRSGQHNYRANVYDVSEHGCKVEFVERPTLDEVVWVKFEGLEALEAIVCWVDDFAAGLEFQRPVHPAVFEVLLQRLANTPHE
ncbi:MAG: PilZ domain-containing protein [Sphingomicrobium sp.]